MRTWAKHFCSVCVLNPKSLCSFDFPGRKVRIAPRVSVASISAFVFLSGLWERMTNDGAPSTSRSLKLWERYDLSPLLTCDVSLHTYSNSWLNPSLFPCIIFSSVCFWIFHILIYILVLGFAVYMMGPFTCHAADWGGNEYESHISMCSIKVSVGSPAPRSETHRRVHTIESICGR